jgi:hypothetical protein
VANKRYCKVSDHGDEFLFFFTLVAILKILVGATDLYALCKALATQELGGGFFKRLN